MDGDSGTEDVTASDGPAEDSDVAAMSEAEARKELARLALALAHANDAYHRHDAPVITDAEYDAQKLSLIHI